MDNKVRILAFIALAALVLSGCGLFTPPPPKPSFKILPDECELQPGETIAFSLQGAQPPGNLKYEWNSVPAGALVSLQEGVTAEFTAPPEPGMVTVRVTVSRDDERWTFERQCEVVAPAATPTPVSEVRIVAPTAVSASPTAVASPTGQLGQVIISEVMINVCGGDDFKRYNQYIELYNMGDVPVDVSDMWIYSPNSDYRGQRLVAWSQRNPDLTFGEGLIFNSTEIPPQGVAVVLPPQYMNGPRPYRMPYNFPPGTVILTVAEDIRLGDHFYGMRADALYHDVVVLYVGGRTAMQGMPISTYGTPRIGSKYLKSVYDDGADGLPLIPAECFSVERIDPTQPDYIRNWQLVRFGSPGEYIP